MDLSTALVIIFSFFGLVPRNWDLKPIPTPVNLRVTPTITATPTMVPNSRFVWPTETPTPTPTPTATPTKRPTSTPTASPVVPTVENVSVRDFIMNEINDYRRSQGLGNVSVDSYTCAFANTRAGEIAGNFSHSGFDDRISANTLPYPSYSYVNENLALNHNYKNVADGWISSSGHAANLRADITYACVGINGNYFAYEGWKP